MQRLDVGYGGVGRILKRIWAPALFVLALCLVVWLRSPGEAPPAQMSEVVFSGDIFGTSYTARVVPAGAVDEARRLQLEDAVQQALQEVDAAMSNWREDSELTRFNQSGTEPFRASPALLEVMAAAQEVSRRSDGAFDVTVGPLVRAWGFGPKVVVGRPTPVEIEALRASFGFQNLELDLANGTLRKTLPDLEVDLSAIAKGYAVDRAADALAALGESRFMVEVGGEVVARGLAGGDRRWRLGIETPDPATRSVYAVLELENAAMATSGDYRAFWTDDTGRRFSHTIDPRTGRPIEHSLASVSVVAASCLQADAWATALNVLGPDEGRRTAEREGLAVVFLEHEAGGGWRETSTAALAPYRAATPAKGDD